MRKLIGLIAMTIVAMPVAAQSVRVRPYTKSNGTMVMPSVRTAPNSTRTNNWSSKPNTNPYNGRRGTVDPYKPKPLKW